MARHVPGIESVLLGSPAVAACLLPAPCVFPVCSQDAPGKGENICSLLLQASYWWCFPQSSQILICPGLASVGVCAISRCLDGLGPHASLLIGGSEDARPGCDCQALEGQIWLCDARGALACGIAALPVSKEMTETSAVSGIFTLAFYLFDF